MTERLRWGRLIRTVRHLTGRQIAARLSLAARQRLYASWPAAARRGLAGDARLSPQGLEAVRGWLAIKHEGPLSPAARTLAQGAFQGRFVFLHREVAMPETGVDWASADMSMLWRYNLHYADYVSALALGAARDGEPGWTDRALGLIEEWRAANPPAPRPAWDPYPLSLRVVNWIAALGLLEAVAGAEARARATQSLAAQGRYLARHIEWHLGGNHLLKNAKALFVLGVALDCPEAPVWRSRGAALLCEELRVQVLADGGHYERSPHYHAIVLEDLLDVLALAKTSGSLPESQILELQARSRLMAGWLSAMRHPDGGLSLFNDGSISGDPAPGELLAYAERLDAGAAPPADEIALSASGYYVMRRGEGRAIVDCGAVGPDELPAHAHADTLSFELCWAGERTIVDSGTSEYAYDELRRYFRSTAAHNTVEVDGVEQSEIWGSHRVGRRARPLGARLQTLQDAVVFAGAHDGYARLGVIHHRHIVATDEAWIVVDELRGNGRHRFDSRLHFHPDLRLEVAGDEWRAAGDRGAWALRLLGPVVAESTSGWYAPDWNRQVAAPVLALRGAAAMPVSFGFVLTRAGVEAELSAVADDRGVTLEGRLAGRPFRFHSDRCTSSS